MKPLKLGFFALLCFCTLVFIGACRTLDNNAGLSPKREACLSCNGTGFCSRCIGSTNGILPCSTCSGTGSVQRGEETVICSTCKGLGKTECSICRGTGRCRDCNGTGIKHSEARP